MKKYRKDFKTSVTVPIYGGRVILFVVEDDRICDTIRTIVGRSDHDDPVCRAMTIYDGGMDVSVVLGRETMGHALIAHEARHVADFIIERIGATVCKETREPCSYLLQWVVNWINQKLERAKIPIKRH